jgi:hypothetical protein
MRNVPSVSHALAVASPEANATATRAAELQEINDLRAEVAELKACTLAATQTAVSVTATPTQVPPLETGVPVSYLGIWSITVLGISPFPTTDKVKPNGKFMQVNVTASHSSRNAELLLLTDFILTDANGRFAAVDLSINQSVYGSTWGLSIAPGVTEMRSIVFDVAADAGDSFILESNADPMFRVAMTVEQRG